MMTKNGGSKPPPYKEMDIIMQEKKKILFVINTMGRAGAEKVLTSLLRVLDTAKVEVDLYSLIGRGEMFRRVPEYVHILNKEPVLASVLDDAGKRYIKKQIYKSLFKKFNFIRYLPYALKNIKAQKNRGKVMPDKLFWKLIADAAPRFNKEYDLAIGFTEGAATYYVANRVKTKKKAAFLHVDYTVAGYVKSLDLKYYEKYDEIFSVSQVVKDNFDSIYPEFKNKSNVFQNIVIPDEIIARSQNGKGFQDDFDGLRILTVARLHPQKALDIAVDAFANFVKLGYDNVRWYVLGKGPERYNLERQIQQHKLEDKFILLGAAPNPYPFFTQCDIYVQASHFEGWSIALAEALILCRPTIISDYAGARDQVEDGETGIIIKLSAENITNALKQMVDDKTLRDKFSANLEKKNTDYAKDVHYIYDLLN